LDKLPPEILEKILYLSLELSLIHTCRYFKATLPHFPTLARELAFAAFCHFPVPDQLDDDDLQHALQLCSLSDVFRAGQPQKAVDARTPAAQVDLQTKIFNASWLSLHWFEQARRDSMEHRLQRDWRSKIGPMPTDMERLYDHQRDPANLDGDSDPVSVCSTLEDGSDLTVYIYRYYSSTVRRHSDSLVELIHEASPDGPYIRVNHIPRRLLEQPLTDDKINFLSQLRRALAGPGPNYDERSYPKELLDDAIMHAIAHGEQKVVDLLLALSRLLDVCKHGFSRYRLPARYHLRAIQSGQVEVLRDLLEADSTQCPRDDEEFKTLVRMQQEKGTEFGKRLGDWLESERKNGRLVAYSLGTHRSYEERGDNFFNEHPLRG
jgi:hypothetical protein